MGVEVVDFTSGSVGGAGKVGEVVRQVSPVRVMSHERAACRGLKKLPSARLNIKSDRRADI